MNGIKPNYSKIAKQFNCDARTVKTLGGTIVSTNNKSQMG